jgi:hypothetical protein
LRAKGQSSSLSSLNLWQVFGAAGAVICFIIFGNMLLGMVLLSFCVGMDLRRRWSVICAEILLYLSSLMELSLFLSSLDIKLLSFYLPVCTAFGVLLLLLIQLVMLFKRYSLRVSCPSESITPYPVRDQKLASQDLRETAPLKYSLLLRVFIALGVFMAVVLQVFDSTIHVIDGFNRNRLAVRALSFPFDFLLFYIGTALTGYKARQCLKITLLGTALWWVIFMLWSYWDICHRSLLGGSC